MPTLPILLVATGLVLSQPGSQPAKSPQPSQRRSAELTPSSRQESTTPGWGYATAVFALSITWSTLVIQVFVVPFYNKGETLHKDYWGSGKINSTLAAIEAGALIPSLARIFNQAASQQKDKRRRPESEMEDLLQSVEFIPDLKSAQDAMGRMEAVRQHYMHVKRLASRLWWVGLVHVLASFCMPVICVFANPMQVSFQWLLCFAVAAWVVTLSFIVWGFFRFHASIERFNTALEFDLTENT